MPFKAPRQQWFRDILEAIVAIEDFTRRMDFEAIRATPMAVAAVERKFQIISEAAIRLGSHVEEQIPDQPWRDIRGLGNQLRHGYERINLQTLWNVVTQDIPQLKAAVSRALDSIVQRRFE